MSVTNSPSRQPVACGAPAAGPLPRAPHEVVLPIAASSRTAFQ